MSTRWIPGKGAYLGLWAPDCQNLSVVWKRGKRKLCRQLVRDARGFFSIWEPRLRPGDRYFFLRDEKTLFPDPASHYQPQGVHGPSEIVDHSKFKWTDKHWRGLKLNQYHIYELHVGTFTHGGTFKSIIPKLPYLKKLGITCIEIMPVHQFPGSRNWGYDGVGLYAVQNSYGGPTGFKTFINACHKLGLAVCLDVVYNHWGPEGNYLNPLGEYFTHRYHTPWGKAVNFDQSEVRQFIIQNALYWIREYHVDALRLDAVHAIYDNRKKHILDELQTSVQGLARRLKRKVVVIAESASNDVKLVKSRTKKGYGLNAMWSDDFHHAIHRSLTGEKQHYYSDYKPIADVAHALKRTFVYSGQYSSFRKQKYGTRAEVIKAKHFVIHTQNHDQIGNRSHGDRLASNISFGAQKSSACLLILSPYTPLIFMGQEYGEISPFQYFVDHRDKELIRAVQRGRQEEFNAVSGKKIPNPKSLATFRRSKLKWSRLNQKRSKQLLSLYTELFKLRQTPPFQSLTKKEMQMEIFRRSLVVIRWKKGLKKYFVIINLTSKSVRYPCGNRIKHPQVSLSSEAIRFGGSDRLNFDVSKASLHMPPHAFAFGKMA